MHRMPSFKMPSRSYPTHFSNVNYSKPKTRLRKSRFQIFLGGVAIWNNFVANTDNTEKEVESSSLFKIKSKN